MTDLETIPGFVHMEGGHPELACSRSDKKGIVAWIQSPLYERYTCRFRKRIISTTTRGKFQIF